MKDKHTPGPWKVDGTYIYEVEQDKILAEVETYNNNELPYEANARLMAAAPELLKALRAVIHAYGVHEFPVLVEARERAKILITKIEGNEYNHLP